MSRDVVKLSRRRFHVHRRELFNGIKHNSQDRTTAQMHRPILSAIFSIFAVLKMFVKSYSFALRLALKAAL